MIIETFTAGPFETNAYVITCPITKHAAIIDPAPGSFKLFLPFIEENGYFIEKILLTHSHWDHFGDLKAAKEKFNAPIYVHAEDAPNVETPGSDGLPLLFFKVEGVKPDIFIKEGDLIEVGNLKLQVIHTPGHSPGGVCFYIEKENLLISGDTLFKGSIGNLSFPTANPDQMWKSLEKLSKLPPETQVFPGHGPSTTIGDEEWLPRAKEIFS